MSHHNAIKSFIESAHIDTHSDLFEEALEALVKAWKSTKDEQDLRIVAQSLDELYDSFKTFRSYRDTRKVSVFGSARTQTSDPDYDLTVQFSSKMTQKGYFIITGAGGGIMEAGNKGAQLNKSFGLNIDLPFEQSANKYIVNDPKLVTYRYFFLRKLFFIKESDATVLLPGGFGTHDEGFESLTLLQNGRCAPRPLILLENKDSQYWDDWLTFIKKQLLEPGYISEEDMHFIRIVNDVDEAVNHITKFYKVYHSIHYLKETTVIRLNSPLSDAKVDAINSTFSDILSSGNFVQCSAEDIDEENGILPHKKRLCFKFNHHNFGRLTALINFINTSA